MAAASLRRSGVKGVNPMQKILAPTRGGAPSYPNQDWAISFAKEHQAELYFLYITDITVLDQHSSSLMLDLEDELDEMGGFVLAMAQERSAKQGVEAQALVRRGHFGDVLKAMIAELEITHVILGSPAEETAVTTSEFLRELADDLAKFHAVNTIVVSRGEMLFEQSANPTPST